MPLLSPNFLERVKVLVNDWLNPVRDTLKARQSHPRGDQVRVMTESEMLDQELEDSFPASDPPGHFSKSIEDRKHHESYGELR